MRYDFWNNPIVVSAFRVKYRRGGLYNITVLYILLMATVGMVLHYYRSTFPPFPRAYMLGLLGLQFFVSGLVAVATTAASFRNEVVNRTLDFQRIASLSPAQILM